MPSPLAKISGKDLVRTLCIVYLLCGGSIHCHVPLEAVENKVPGHERGKIKKALRELVKKGLVYEKTHGKRRSYGLTREGVQKAYIYCRIQ